MPALLESHKPLDMVIIKLGTNDLKNCYGVSAADIAFFLDRPDPLGQLPDVVSDVGTIYRVADLPPNERGDDAPTIPRIEGSFS